MYSYSLFTSCSLLLSICSKWDKAGNTTVNPSSSPSLFLYMYILRTWLHGCKPVNKIQGVVGQKTTVRGKFGRHTKITKPLFTNKRTKGLILAKKFNKTVLELIPLSTMKKHDICATNTSYFIFLFMCKL